MQQLLQPDSLLWLHISAQGASCLIQGWFLHELWREGKKNFKPLQIDKKEAGTGSSRTDVVPISWLWIWHKKRRKGFPILQGYKKNTDIQYPICIHLGETIGRYLPDKIYRRQGNKMVSNASGFSWKNAHLCSENQSGTWLPKNLSKSAHRKMEGDILFARLCQ